MPTSKSQRNHLNLNLADRLVRQHGPELGLSVLNGAEAVMSVISSLPRSTQRPVLELLFEAFEQAHQPVPTQVVDENPAHLARRCSSRLARKMKQLWPFQRSALKN